MAYFNLNSGQEWIPSEESLLMPFLIARVGIIDMSKPVEMVREFDDMTRTLTNWGMKELCPVDVVVKVHELFERYVDFIWFSNLPGVTYDSMRNRVSVNEAYWNYIGKETERMRALKENGEPNFGVFQDVFDRSRAGDLDYEWVALKLTVGESDSKWIH